MPTSLLLLHTPPYTRRDRTPGPCANGIGRRLPHLLLSAALSLVLASFFMSFASIAGAVLISTGDGTGNTTPPPASEDPGFDHVGRISGTSGVYVGNGWVLTARHVGIGSITLMGVTYEPVPDSETNFTNADNQIADLVAFKLRTQPPLPNLTLATSPPATNTRVTVIGSGRSRGAPLTFSGMPGWAWGNVREMRWGTNRIAATQQSIFNTDAFSITFDDLPATGANPHEADIIAGDSGGGAFTGNASNAVLIGILFAHSGFDGQPESTSVFGNIGFIVDLYQYRDQIISVISHSQCSNGLDDDGDGFIDFGVDPGCQSMNDATETNPALVCDNGIDDDGDGFTDFPSDTGCDFPWEADEQTPLHECDNGIDDDGDSTVDFPNDPGCLHPSNTIEAPEPSGLLLLTSGLVALCGLSRTRLNSARASHD